MPFIHVRTNLDASDAVCEAVKRELGRAVEALPGKSENWLMVGIEPSFSLWFQGSNEGAAMVTVSLYGGASEEAYDSLTSRITEILSELMHLAPDRIYVEYQETPYWGWNGRNF
ncbi:phenylpyruvate tautomerase MIF-related protein [uncultured Ruthenibacterium sp.]|mgnify:CR=1 FL=1|uniref:phenylpyruvate tautomerase MIF-related protein n=1 Tax=uncultured Ruthenibacterium sp. TaxID=1905347 RepID=UPI00349EC6B2